MHGHISHDLPETKEKKKQSKLVFIFGFYIAWDCSWNIQFLFRIECDVIFSHITCKLLATHRSAFGVQCICHSNIVESRSSYLYFRSIPHKLKKNNRNHLVRHNHRIAIQLMPPLVLLLLLLLLLGVFKSMVITLLILPPQCQPLYPSIRIVRLVRFNAIVNCRCHFES